MNPAARRDWLLLAEAALLVARIRLMLTVTPLQRVREGLARSAGRSGRHAGVRRPCLERAQCSPARARSELPNAVARAADHAGPARY